MKTLQVPEHLYDCVITYIADQVKANETFWEESPPDGDEDALEEFRLNNEVKTWIEHIMRNLSMSDLDKSLPYEIDNRDLQTTRLRLGYGGTGDYIEVDPWDLVTNTVINLNSLNTDQQGLLAGMIRDVQSMAEQLSRQAEELEELRTRR